MLNIVISLVVALLVHGGLSLLAGVDQWIATIASVVTFLLLYFLLTRFVMKKIGVLMESAQRDIQAGRAEKAVKELQGGFKYAKWQFYIKGQLNAQIGTILYLKRDFTQAFDYLQKGFVRHWVAMGMLGICYMKRNKSGKMIETFDKATAANKKEPMLWNLYGYCLDKIGQTDQAIAVMEKGIKKTGGNEALQANLDALKAGKKMKMQAYGDLWYQFHLESQGTLIKQQTKAMQGRRKIVRR
ncbi:tetratricopeptide repeat protein [Trichloromonas sp.]|uniref:tetratricopeptide repeat protein n=1 Tax=Trichloromonas sp. TaxID=3069249 RepID=UPI003D81C246